MVYGCDRAWWDYRRGLPNFHGLKISWAKTQFDSVRTIEIQRIKGDSYSDELSLEPGVIGGGGNSGFQALNLAIQWGARKIILIGFDMTDQSGVHWYGRNLWPMGGNPTSSNFPRWINAFNGAVPLLQSIGADVVNVSPNSALGAFRRSSIDAVLKEWA